MHKNSSVEKLQVRQVWMRPMLFCSAFILLALALACSPSTEKSATTAANNDPDQLLRQMSEKQPGKS